MQGDMHVKVGERLLLRKQLIDAGATRQEPKQPRLGGHDDVAAAFLHQRGETDEVQGVAQSLLGVYQDPAAGQGRTVPDRLRKRTQGDALADPTPFMLGPTPFVVALKEPDDRSVAMGGRMVRLQMQRLLVASTRFVELALLLEYRAQCIVDACIRRRETDGLLQASNSFIQLALVAQDNPQIVVCFGMVGLQAHGLPERRRLRRACLASRASRRRLQALGMVRLKVQGER